MITAGIDPGKGGHVMAVDVETRQVLKSWRQPLIGDGKGDTFDRVAMDAIAGELRTMGVRAVALELTLPAGRARSSTHALFRQGQGYGLWQGILTSNRLPVIEATPQAWRKALGVPQPKIAKGWRGAAPSEEAEEADRGRQNQQRELGLLEVVKKVQSLFPCLDLRLTEKSTTPSPDKAVAALLALFAAGVRVDGAAARKLSPEEAAAELEEIRQQKARAAAERTRKREAEEREKRDAAEKREAARAEKKRLAAEEKARKAAAREAARVERERIKAEKVAARAEKRLAVEGV
jgi:hypothetical protein